MLCIGRFKGINKYTERYLRCFRIIMYKNKNNYYKNHAFTIIEFSLVIVIFSLMYGMMAPTYVYYVDMAKTNEAETTITDISKDIDDFFLTNGHYPDTLEEVYGEVPLDDWGNPYQYLRIDGGNIKGKGKLRKDKNLVPINSDYDLYSMGPDGKSSSALTAEISRDDIVRGRNGGFFGVAEDY